MSNHLYSIVTSLQMAQGSIAKQAILDANKDNELFKAYMKATYDIGINYYMKMPKLERSIGGEFCESVAKAWLQDLSREIANRKRTGADAKKFVKTVAECFDEEGQELTKYIFNRSIGASVGDTMVLKTWPDLYFLPPYMRCSLMDKKAKERFAKLKMFYVQTKCDGSFAYVGRTIDGVAFVYTRQGGKYPQDFADKLAQSVPNGVVLVGELEVNEHGPGMGCQTLERKTANGILNSVLKDGEGLAHNQNAHLTIWDLLETHEFKAGKSNRPYRERLKTLDNFMSSNPAYISKVGHYEVSSLDEAYTIYTNHTSMDLEGCVAKDPESLWKDGTSKDNVKMKLRFSVEMLCTGIYEGEGKYKGMMGGGYFQSKDGGIENEAGTGFSDKQRKDFFDNPSLIVQKVCELEANDITQSRDVRKKPSLSLPVFCEVRDKAEADTTEHIYAQLAAAKDGK